MRRLFVFVLLCFAVLPALAQTSQCETVGTTSRVTYTSSLSGAVRYFSIYLPPCYESSSESYSVLFLLHGSNTDDSQWINLGFVEALESAISQGDTIPFLLVMPFGSNVANDNSFEGISYDEILLELIDKIDAEYRTNGTRAIGGISRGGFWAYHMGLRYPDKFVAIGGHSPFFDPTHVAPEYNPLSLAGEVPQATHLKLWLDKGTNDYAADGIDRMDVVLTVHKIPHIFQVYLDGEHTEASWAEHSPDYLAFYISVFNDDGEQDASPSNDENTVELWLPIGAFPALRTSLSREQLDSILKGELNSELVLTQFAREQLTAHGFIIHSDSFVVADDTLDYHLWNNKNRFSLIPFDQLTLRFRPLWLDDIPVVDRLDDYPLVWQSEAGNFNPDKLTRISTSGTTALARQTRVAIDEHDLDWAVSGIQDYVMRSDMFQITNEVSIAPTCPQFTDEVLGGGSSMCMNPAHQAFFDLLDVDLVDLTGNHISDFGYSTLNTMLDLFEESGIQIVGGGRDVASAREPLVLDINATKIGWIACNDAGPYYALANDDPNLLGGVRPGGAECDETWLSDALPILASQVDVVIMTVQYLEIEDYLPSSQQEFDFRQYAEWGADIVLGTADHKPMTFEYYQTRRGETAFIHYSLGNLFFDQPFWGNMRFFIDTLYLYDGKLVTIELYPGIIDELARPRLMTGDDLTNFLHFMFIQQNGF